MTGKLRPPPYLSSAEFHLQQARLALVLVPPHSLQPAEERSLRGQWFTRQSARSFCVGPPCHGHVDLAGSTHGMPKCKELAVGQTTVFCCAPLYPHHRPFKTTTELALNLRQSEFNLEEVMEHCPSLLREKTPSDSSEPCTCLQNPAHAVVVLLDLRLLILTLGLIHHFRLGRQNDARRSRTSCKLVDGIQQVLRLEARNVEVEGLQKHHS